MSSRFTILNPCSKQWSELPGNGRKRYCNSCGIHIHAIDEYSEDERIELWHESQGVVCGYLQEKSPEEPRSRRTILLGGLLSAVSPLFAQTGSVRFRVTDERGSVIANAQISILSNAGTPRLTDETGESVWSNLPIGNNQFSISSPGFKLKSVTVLTKINSELKMEIKLEVGSIGTVISVEPDPSEPPQQLKKLKRRRWWIFG